MAQRHQLPSGRMAQLQILRAAPLPLQAMAGIVAAVEVGTESPGRVVIPRYGARAFLPGLDNFIIQCGHIISQYGEFHVFSRRSTYWRWRGTGAYRPADGR